MHRTAAADWDSAPSRTRKGEMRQVFGLVHGRLGRQSKDPTSDAFRRAVISNVTLTPGSHTRAQRILWGLPIGEVIYIDSERTHQFRAIHARPACGWKWHGV